MTSFHLFHLYLQTKEQRRIYWISQFYFTSASVLSSTKGKFNKKNYSAQIKRLSGVKRNGFHIISDTECFRWNSMKRKASCSQPATKFHQLQLHFFVPFVADLLNKFSFPIIHSSAKIDWLNGLVLGLQSLFIDSVSVHFKWNSKWKLDFHWNN